MAEAGRQFSSQTSTKHLLSGQRDDKFQNPSLWQPFKCLKSIFFYLMILLSSVVFLCQVFLFQFFHVSPTYCLEVQKGAQYAGCSLTEAENRGPLGPLLWALHTHCSQDISLLGNLIESLTHHTCSQLRSLCFVLCCFIFNVICFKCDSPILYLYILN